MKDSLIRWYLLLIGLLALAAPVMAQEEAAESNLGPGLMVFVLATGILMVLVLGAATSAQEQDEEETAEQAS